MKSKNIYKAAIALTLVVVVMGCRPDEFAPIGEAPDRLSQLNGVWNLTTVIQIDLDAQSKGFPDFAQRQDVTGSFDFSDFSLTLDADGSFTVVEGNSPNIVGGLTNGTWVADNDEFPSTVIFTEGQTSNSLAIGSFADVSNNRISFTLVRLQSEVPVVRYEYFFTKQ